MFDDDHDRRLVSFLQHLLYTLFRSDLQFWTIMRLRVNKIAEKRWHWPVKALICINTKNIQEPITCGWGKAIIFGAPAAQETRKCFFKSFFSGRRTELSQFEFVMIRPLDTAQLWKVWYCMIRFWALFESRTCYTPNYKPFKVLQNCFEDVSSSKLWISWCEVHGFGRKAFHSPAEVVEAWPFQRQLHTSLSCSRFGVLTRRS